jgi:hypothetical protein
MRGAFAIVTTAGRDAVDKAVFELGIAPDEIPAN